MLSNPLWKLKSGSKNSWNASHPSLCVPRMWIPKAVQSKHPSEQILRNWNRMRSASYLQLSYTKFLHCVMSIHGSKLKDKHLDDGKYAKEILWKFLCVPQRVQSAPFLFLGLYTETKSMCFYFQTSKDIIWTESLRFQHTTLHQQLMHKSLGKWGSKKYQCQSKPSRVLKPEEILLHFKTYGQDQHFGTLSRSINMLVSLLLVRNDAADRQRTMCKSTTKRRTHKHSLKGFATKCKWLERLVSPILVFMTS